ncbi:UDP-glucose 6-dehydrogenase 1 [Acorus calamus]|uniref:UDP-glucose 6-dehydrogenase 1 n=1 Tax=Acorus calamus TaxID=4465 RepID=A0AAV9E9F6_ACOCL|nr:UDP-glucose 6-dehydrogenase 1 [Acorus calamus]
MIVVVETEVVHPHGFIDLSSYIDLTDISSDWVRRWFDDSNDRLQVIVINISTSCNNARNSNRLHIFEHGLNDIVHSYSLTSSPLSLTQTSSSSLSITHKTRDLGANKTANLIYWESAICMIAPLTRSLLRSLPSPSRSIEKI